MNVYMRLLKMVKPYISKFILAFVCMLAVGATQSILALLVKPVLDDVFVDKNADMLFLVFTAIISVALIRGVCTYGQTVLMNFIGLRIVTDLRSELYNHIQRQSLAFFYKNPTGTLMSRITNDVSLVQTAVSEAVTSILKDSVTLVGLIFVVFYRDWKLAIIAMVVFPLTLFPIIKFGQKMRKISSSTQVTLGGLTNLLQETIAGTRIVKAFGMEVYEGKRFAKENENLYKLFMKSVSIRAISSPLMELLGYTGVAVIVFYGGYQVIRGTSTTGTFFSFITALLFLYEPVKRLANVNITIQQGIAGALRVFEIMDRVPEIRDTKGAVILPGISQQIEIKNVTFSYSGEKPVLNDINLSIKVGEIVAFVGMSGGGKSTLVNLIPRFYEVSEGAILIDGVDIRGMTVKSLRDQIGIVTQQVILFNDTVRNNIAYGDIRTGEEDIIKASKAANAHGFIMRLPQGYNTVIGEQGVRLSGGERQRISIARSILKDAPILILDEATSSLDTEAEKEVQEALETLMKGRTTLVIAHRLSTIRHADRIVVLVNGKIIEEGDHESLMKKRGEYFRLYAMQFESNGKGAYEYH